MRKLRFTVVVAVLALLGGVAVRAELPGAQPFAGVGYRLQTRTDPPMRLHVATVDLTNPKVHLRVARGGPDPDGRGEWETTLMQPTAIAAREGFDLVINGGFFAVREVKDADGFSSKYGEGRWAAALGPAVTDGKTWSTAKAKMPCLIVRKPSGGSGRGKVAVEQIGKPSSDAWAVVAGKQLLVEAGKLVPPASKDRHPRTAVGVNENGTKLTILVVDGRRPGTSMGMTLDELAKEMLRLGCWRAINLDGGGSSVMAMRDPGTDSYKILNLPSDGRERAVANVLGISVDKPKSKKPDTRSGPAK